MDATRRYLLLSAGMGDGHVQVARELQRRLRARGSVADVVDILEVLPLRIGPLLRHGYRAMLSHAPWLYESIYRGFFAPTRRPVLRADPLVALAAPRVERLCRSGRYDVVVSTFHLCGQVTGRLRARGRLRAAAVVVVTDFVAHRMWLHPGNDMYLCAHPSVAAEVDERVGPRAFAAAPVLPAPYTASANAADRAEAAARVRAELALPAGRPVALMTAGAWGAGDVAAAARVVAGAGAAVVVLCGRNDALRRQLTEATDDAGRWIRALGWRTDVPDLLRAADVLVENAAGQSALEAMAISTPVVTLRPIPGHGRAGAQRMAELGLSTFVSDAAALPGALSQLCDPASARRAAQVAAGRAIFTSDPVDLLVRARPVEPLPPPAPRRR
jgi:UDP-N-acetylglucosamine:LPS N-acetylglucosamine transferase